jgi:hypothetical protein
VALLVTEPELLAALDLPVDLDPTPYTQACVAADNTVRRWLSEAKGPHDDHAWDREAALAVAVQIYVSRTAPGGQMNSLDYQPMTGPHLLGPGLSGRVMGLIEDCREHGSVVIA